MSRTPARRGHINWRPFAPDAPFPPPPLVLLPAPLRAILQLPRGTQSSARAFAERGGLLSSVPRDLSASRESNEKEVWESAFAPSSLPPPPPSSPKFARRNRNETKKPSPEILPFPAVLSRSWIEKREGGHTRAPRYLCPIRAEIRIGKKDKGGVCALNGFLGVTIFVPAFPFLWIHRTRRFFCVCEPYLPTIFSVCVLGRDRREIWWVHDFFERWKEGID